ncbi:MAG: hypothetical protein R2882_10490 [Gemmatimonadales bacterium]
MKRLMILGAALLAACATSDLPVAPNPAAPADAGHPELGPPPVGTNADPVVAIADPSDGDTVPLGTALVLAADFTDADAGDLHTCNLDWSVAMAAGTVAETDGVGTCGGSFSFPTVGTYQIVVSVIDNLGGTGADTVTIEVVDAPAEPPAPPTPPAVTPGSVVGYGSARLQSSMVRSSGRRAPSLWFNTRTRVSKTGKVRGFMALSVPEANLRLAGKVETAQLADGTALLQGQGRVGRHRGTYQWLVSVAEGRRSGGRIRVKIWNESGVLVDTQPSDGDSADPTLGLSRGLIRVRP